MEFFPDGLVVRLRSRTRGLYLYARDDDLGVTVSPRRSSPNTGWEVRRFQQEGTDTDCFVLRSSATGRCLAAAESAAHQRKRSAVPSSTTMSWGAAVPARDDVDTLAGLRHGDVILRDFFSRKLCAEAEPRYGNDVFVELDSRGKNRRSGTTSASHWFLEAALPLSLRLAPRPPSKVS